MAKIYVASSWRNPYYPEVVNRLREAGHEVYDFRNPPDGSKGFFWKDVDENWEDWTVSDYRKGLTHPWSEFGCINYSTTLQTIRMNCYHICSIMALESVYI